MNQIYLHLRLPFLILIGSIISMPVFSQPHMGLSISSNHALGELKSEGYKDGIGMSSYILTSPIKSAHSIANIQFGGILDLTFNGEQKNDILGFVPGTNNLSNVDITNSIFGLHAMTRISTSDVLPVQLYVDGLVGGRLFSTSANYDYYHEDACPTPTNLSRSLSFSYGGSIGTLIKLSPYSNIDIRATYLLGSPVNFVPLHTVSQTEQGAYTYSYGTSSAPATQLGFNVGLNFKIDGCIQKGSSSVSNSSDCSSPLCTRNILR